MTFTIYDYRRAKAQLNHAKVRRDKAVERLGRLQKLGKDCTDDEIDVIITELNDSNLELALAQIALDEIKSYLTPEQLRGEEP